FESLAIQLLQFNILFLRLSSQALILRPCTTSGTSISQPPGSCFAPWDRAHRTWFRPLSTSSARLDHPCADRPTSATPR
ncbi:RDH8 isoform 2, partial [Pongo abelii]